jgi:hypothetical protein
MQMPAKRFQDRFQEAMNDVSKMFERPRALFDDPAFDAAQKRKLLQQWEYDLRQMQVATEENMAAPDSSPGSGTSGELLQEVQLCLRRLGDRRSPARSASHKPGG